MSLFLDLVQYNLDVTVPASSSIFNGGASIVDAITQFVNDVSFDSTW